MIRKQKIIKNNYLKGYNVQIMGNICYRCNYIWRSNNMEQKPNTCSNCRSPYWDKPKRKFK